MKNTFLATYQKLNAQNLHLLETIYSHDVTFVDPAHEVIGLDDLNKYFAKLYKNIKTIEFKYQDVISEGSCTSIYWEMTYSHVKINSGNPVTVSGNTFLQFDDSGKVNYHRDYFDLGEMLYEQIPFLKRLVRYVKQKLAEV